MSWQEGIIPPKGNMRSLEGRKRHRRAYRRECKFLLWRSSTDESLSRSFRVNFHKLHHRLLITAPCVCLISRCNQGKSLLIFYLVRLHDNSLYGRKAHKDFGKPPYHKRLACSDPHNLWTQPVIPLRDWTCSSNCRAHTFAIWPPLVSPLP